MAKGRLCFSCKSTFPATNEFFFRHSQRKDGLHSWCKDCCRIGNLKSKQKLYSTFEGRIKTFLRSCKNSSEKRGHEFSITRQDLIDMWERQEGICVYTGLKMELQPNTLLSVSVERINSDIGYTSENTVLCCNVVNRMKSDLDAEIFFDICKSVTMWLSNENLTLDVEFVKDA